MAFMFYETPLLVVQYLMEDDSVWIAPRSWVKTKEARNNLNGDAHSATLYSIFSPDWEHPLDLVWIIESDYGYRLANDDETYFLDRYLSAYA